MKTLPCVCGEQPTTILSPFKIVGCLSCANGQLGTSVKDAKQKWNAFISKQKPRCAICLQTWCTGCKE